MKIYLETYGCTANKADASLMIGLLKSHHHDLISTMDDADTLVLLTCTVIGTTEQRMLSRLRVFSQTKKPVIVAGCMASVQDDLLRSISPEVKLLPPQYSHHIVDIIEDKDVTFTKKKKTLFPKFFGDIVAPIAIAEGCNALCSYCITHHARGKLTSYPIEEIIQDIQCALRQGCKEIQLTAQDTASYGLDKGINLGNLLSQICIIEKPFRIRVGMMNPYTAHKNLDSIVSAYVNQKIYKFLHLPVQSGDNDILKRMNRGYTVEDFIRIVKTFRKTYPNLVLSTDIIVGFPTETDEQFNNSIKLLQTVKPDIVNITRYSARPLTMAKTMKGRIPTKVAKERSKQLTQLCTRLSEEINAAHVGRETTVLVTESGKGNTVVARAENYKPIILKKPVELGTFHKIEIIDAKATYLVGKLI